MFNYFIIIRYCVSSQFHSAKPGVTKLFPTVGQIIERISDAGHKIIVFNTIKLEQNLREKNFKNSYYSMLCSWMSGVQCTGTNLTNNFIFMTSRNAVLAERLSYICETEVYLS